MATTSHMKEGNWSPKEDEALTIAYIKISENTKNGTNQSNDSFWLQIQQTYLEYYQGNTRPKMRSKDSCEFRWKKHIFPKMNKWHQCVKRAERRIQSGANLSDQHHKAKGYYKAEMEGKQLKFENYFKLCNDWVTFQDPPQEEYGPTPVQRNSSYSLDDNESPIEVSPTPTPTPTPIPRTTGRNATRRLREMAKETDMKAIGQELVANMKEMHAQQRWTEEEKIKREKQREEQRELARDEAILLTQTTDFTPISKAYFDGKKREIKEKMRARELFPDSDSTSNLYRPQMSSDVDE